MNDEKPEERVDKVEKSKRPRRRLFRFSLRMMFVNLAIFAILTTTWLLPSLRQYDAGKSIDKEGGHYLFHISEEDLNIGRTPGESNCDNQTSIFAHFFKRIKHVSITAKNRTSISWGDIPNLEYLSIYDSDTNLFSRDPSTEDIRYHKQLIASLSPLQSLKSLKIYQLSISPESIEAISQLRNIESLELYHDSAAKEYGFESLAKLTRLKKLTLHNHDNESFLDLAKLSGISTIEDLDIRWNSKPGSFANMTKLKRLKFLTIGNFDSIEDCSFLPFLISLEGLTVENSEVQKIDAKVLARMPMLKSLDLNCQIDDVFLAEFSKIATLEQLSLSKMDAVEDSGVSHLVKLANLKTLSIRTKTVTSEGFAKLASMPSLTSLGLTLSKITDKELAGLFNSHSLEKIYLGYANITQQGLRQLLETNRTLKSVDVTRCRHITQKMCDELMREFPKVKIERHDDHIF